MQHSLYLHIPFCRHRCAYCDFNTYARQERLIPAYVRALCAEIEYVGSRAPIAIGLHTVYFGGGTPSLLTSQQIGDILATVQRNFAVDQDAEVSLEANPGTASRKSLVALRALGVNRISYGVQSTNGEELRLLERQHTYLDVLDAVSGARSAGFDNINVDLIFGLPGQDARTWQITIERSLKLNPEHISAYALTLEGGTPFGHWLRRGELPLPDPDMAADMYEILASRLEAAGYLQYEISNWSKDGRECRHNLQYWRGLPYLGLGAGAHGYAGGYRYSNVLGIENYVRRLHRSLDRPSATDAGGPEVGQVLPADQRFPFSPAMSEQHRQSDQDEMNEFMFTGLRLTREGVNSRTFRKRFGRDLASSYARQFARLTQLGLIERCGDDDRTSTSAPQADERADLETFRLTKRGRLLGNQVFVEFVG